MDSLSLGETNGSVGSGQELRAEMIRSWSTWEKPTPGVLYANILGMSCDLHRGPEALLLA